jgi:hypothetical protein
LQLHSSEPKAPHSSHHSHNSHYLLPRRPKGGSSAFKTTQATCPNAVGDQKKTPRIATFFLSIGSGLCSGNSNFCYIEHENKYKDSNCFNNTDGH